MRTENKIRSKKDQAGFTLLELLISMGLVSVLGIVLFSSYRMLLVHGQEAKEHILEEESKRQLKSIFDNDLANVTDRLGFSPPIQKQSFIKLGIANDTNEDDIPVLAFITTYQLFKNETRQYFFPVYVEYVMRKGKNGYNLFRKEREFPQIAEYGVSHEMLILRGILEFESKVVIDNKAVAQWDNLPNGKIQMIEIALVLQNGQEQKYIIPILEQFGDE